MFSGAPTSRDSDECTTLCNCLVVLVLVFVMVAVLALVLVLVLVLVCTLCIRRVQYNQSVVASCTATFVQKYLHTR